MIFFVDEFLFLKITAGKSHENVGVIRANVDDPNSLSEMAKKGKIVLNCVGPYRYEGNSMCYKCV